MICPAAGLVWCQLRTAAPGRAAALRQAGKRAGRENARVCMPGRFLAYADNKRMHGLTAVSVIRTWRGSCFSGDVVTGGQNWPLSIGGGRICPCSTERAFGHRPK